MGSNGGGGIPGVRFDNSGDVFQSVIDGAKKAVDKAGRNFGDSLKNSAYGMSKGDLNNAGNVFINDAGYGISGGQLNLNLETSIQRKDAEDARTKENNDANAVYANALAQKMDRENRVLNVLEGSARSRQQAPGSAATSIMPNMNNASPGSNTLITIRGGR